MGLVLKLNKPKNCYQLAAAPIKSKKLCISRKNMLIYANVINLQKTA